MHVATATTPRAISPGQSPRRHLNGVLDSPASNGDNKTTESMAQKKGHTGNPKGRPKGKPNKLTSTVREWIAELIDSNRDQVEKDLKALKPIERVQMIERLMQYVVPKQQAVSAAIDFSQLTDSQLDEVVNRLTQGISYDED